MRKILVVLAATAMLFGAAACDKEDRPDLRDEKDDVVLVGATEAEHPKIQARLDNLGDRTTKLNDRVTRLTFVADEALDKANLLIEQVNCLAATADADEGACVAP